MGKNKKKREALRKQKQKDFNLKLLESKKADIERKVRSRGKIPKDVAIVSIEEEIVQEIKKECFILIFHNYNNSTCDLCNLRDKNSSEKLIGIFNEMTKTSPRDMNKILKKNNNKPIIKRNEAEGEYKKLFNNLPDEIEVLFESKQFQGDEGRVYFFPIYGTEKDKRNFLNIVSINPNHLEKH